MLEKPVLLLNNSYEPLRVINWKRAITLFYLEKVEILENYNHYVRSINFKINCPSVVKLKYYVKAHRSSPKPTRTLILKRDDHVCQYCGKKLKDSKATLDHLLPKSRGGKLTFNNVVCSCYDCNLKKGNRTPDEASMPLISNSKRKLDWIKVFYLMSNKEILDNWKPYLFNVKI